MYGWERKSGKMRDHFAEEMTEDDVLRVLNQTKSALLTPSSSSAATNRKKNGDDGDEEARPRVMLLPSPPPRAAAVPEGASFDVWTDAKAAGVDAYQRGDFRDAAACFASAAGMLTAHRAARVTRRPASTSPSDLAEAVHDVTLDDDDEQGKQAQEQRETLPTPAGDIAVDLSALHSNRSSALLVGRERLLSPLTILLQRRATPVAPCAPAAGEPRDALAAAEACVAARPAWDKAHYRRGEAHFAMRLFSRAAEDFRTARERAARAVPDPHLEARLAAAEAMMVELRELDTEEASLLKDKEERGAKEKRAGDKDAADKEIAELTAAAEERERDPRVKRLVKEVEELFDRAKNADEGGEGARGGGGAGPPPERILPLLQEILKVEPDFTQVSFQAAVTLRRVGRVAEAVTTLRRCLQSAPGFMLGYSVFGHMLESVHGREREAEGVYLHAIGVYFDHPDAWVNLASLLVRAGRISDAIGLLRQAAAGGPEGKFRKPREDPSVLMLLGYLLHLRGHSAEPTSLYMMALGCGGGPLAAFLLGRMSEETGDDEQARLYYANLAGCYAQNPAAMYRGFEVLNAHFAAPHWAALSAKIELHRLLRDAGLEGVVAPPCFVAEEEEEEEEEEKRKEGKEKVTEPEGKEEDGGAHDDDERRGDRGGEGAGLWILKGKNRVYEGARSHPRVIRAESAADVAAAVASAAKAASHGTHHAPPPTTVNADAPGAAATRAVPGVGVMAQRCVSDPLLVHDGGRKKATLHFYVCVTDVRAAAAAASSEDGAADAVPAAVIHAGLSTGFTLKTAPDVYSEDSLEDASHITNRGAGGDAARCHRREITGPEAAEAWAAEAGADWSGGVWPGVRRAAESVLSAACRARLGVPIGAFDARVHARLRIPKVLELVFVVDRGSRPWLIDVNAHPSTETHAGATRDGVLHRVIDEAWGVATAAEEKALDPLFA